MKIRVNLWLTIFLFVMMVLAGIASTCMGYFMGREALKVVTQPDINFDNNTKNQKPVRGEHKGLKIIKEQDILVQMYNIVNAKN
ncbi:hypothetical protein NIES4102_23200 [Chondrocystis sp. NIES-4102]|nr:hypothetical protein NIES4102_23200 [Chondrocystis sp. NIES-4102]